MPKLDTKEIAGLLKYSENKERQSAPKVKWPSDRDMLAVALAYKERKRYVVLSSGLFIIKHYDDKRKQLHLIPKEGFVPCGWFDYKAFEEVLAEGAH